MATSSNGYVVAFDFGLRHIGVAVGQTITRTARGVATLNAHQGKPDWRALQALLDEYSPILAVVGLPLNMDDTRSEMAEAASRFAQQITKRCGLETQMHDERLSTRDARRSFADAKAMGIAASEHELAACLILESWFASTP